MTPPSITFAGLDKPWRPGRLVPRADGGRGRCGNVVGYWRGQLIGPAWLFKPRAGLLGQDLHPEHLDQTHDCSSSATAPKALVLARFVPFVRTFVTLVAGVGRHELPHVHHLDGHRRRDLGGRGDRARLLPRQRPLHQAQHRRRAGADRAGLVVPMVVEGSSSAAGGGARPRPPSPDGGAARDRLDAGGARTPVRRRRRPTSTPPSTASPAVGWSPSPGRGSPPTRGCPTTAARTPASNGR